VEVENINQAVISGFQLLFWDPLGKDLCVVIHADDWVIPLELSEETVVRRLKDADSSALSFTGNIGLLDKCFDEIVYRAVFVDK